MDLESEEMVATNEDSGEVDDNAYLSRLMMTGQPSSCLNVVSSSIIDGPIVHCDCSPQIEVLCCPGESRNAFTSKPTNRSMVSANPKRGETINEECNSGGSEEIRVVTHVPTQNAEQTDAPQQQYGPVLRSSVRRNFTQKTDPSPAMIGAPRKVHKQRSTPKRKSSDSEVINASLATVEKGTMTNKPIISPGAVRRKTGRILLRSVVNRRNKFGETKLHLAVMQEDIEDVQDMISVGSNVNAIDYAGWTPLHEAVCKNNFEITDILLQAGAQVNCRGDGGITPLHDAMKYHFYKITKLLLKNGADPFSKCDEGQTPMDMTTDRCAHLMVEKYLQKPEVEASALMTLKNVLNTGRNQGEDLSGQSSFLLQDKENELDHPDTSSYTGSDVTVDYIEQNSPQYWTICATQDFSSSIWEPGATDAISTAESKSAHKHHNVTSTAAQDDPSMTSKGDSVCGGNTTALSAEKQEVEETQGSRLATVVKRRKVEKGFEQKFLEYLLNFKMSSIDTGSKKDHDHNTLLQTEDETNGQITDDIPQSTQSTIHELNRDGQDCSMSLLPPHSDEGINSCLQTQFKGDGLELLSSEKTSNTSSPCSQSLLMNIMQNPEIVSQDYLQSNEPIKELETANKEVLDPERPKAQLSSDSLSLQRAPGRLETSIITCNHLKVIFQELESPETHYSQSTPQNSSNQQEMVEISQAPCENLVIHSQTLTDLNKCPDVDSCVICKEPDAKEAFKNVNTQDTNQFSVIENDMNENSTDSDCTLVEMSNALKNHALNDLINTGLDKASDPDEKHGHKESQCIMGLPPTFITMRLDVSDKTNLRVGPEKSSKEKNPTNSRVPDALKKDSKKELKIAYNNIHKRNYLGETYLHRACLRGDLEQVKCLIEAGSNVNAKDHAGWTPLHEACFKGFVDIAKLLLEAGADVTSRGIDGRNPLHDAVKTGPYEIVKLLLQFGASPQDKDMLGQSALDLAEQESIKQLLLTFKGPLSKPDQQEPTVLPQEPLLRAEVNIEPESDFEEFQRNSDEVPAMVPLGSHEDKESQFSQCCSTHSHCLKSQQDLSTSDKCHFLGKYECLRSAEVMSTCCITDGIIRHGDDELEIFLKGHSHKASLLVNGGIGDATGRVFPLLEQWVESVQEGQAISSNSNWKRLMCQSKALWNSSSGCLITEKTSNTTVQLKSFTNSSSEPVVQEQDTSESLMKIKSIRLVSDEEYFPSHLMNQYWDILTQSKVWDFEP